MDEREFTTEEEARLKEIAEKYEARTSHTLFIALLDELARLRAAALTVESQYPKDDAPASIRWLRAALREKGAEKK